jgi:oxygen-independent coproporphyrinogen-3 oxidase
MRPVPPVSTRDTGLYIHFPYCEKKCPYCDFNSHVVPHDDAAYADAILRELDARAPAHRLGVGFRTLYFGGGTPSLWDPKEVARVIRTVREGHGLHESAEITLEANPGTVHTRLFEAFVEAGVNRFSIGAQSFVPDELVQLGRIHGAAAGREAVRAARASGARVSLDLIYAQPGQRWSDVERSVETALELEPDHVSAYTLTVEPDTVLGRQHAEGRFIPMEDDEQAELIERVSARLLAAGHRRYEVSSYAREGIEAVHNTLYWVGGGYLGLGAGAHSYLPAPGLAGSRRRGNLKSPALYLDSTRAKHTPAFEEDLSLEIALQDRLMMGVRTIFGLDLRALDEEAGLGGELVSGLGAEVADLEHQGLLLHQDGWIAPTVRGFYFVDLLARRLAAPLREMRELDRPRSPVLE